MKRNQKTSRRRYDSDFKANILKMHEDGRSVSSLAVSFGISEQLIYRWRRDANKLESGSSTEDLEELRLLRKQVKDLQTERDILKKALGIFSRADFWPNTR